MKSINKISNLLGIISLSQLVTFQVTSFAPLSSTLRTSTRSSTTSNTILNANLFHNDNLDTDADNADTTDTTDDNTMEFLSSSKSSSTTRKEFITTAGLLSSLITMNNPSFAEDDSSSLSPSSPPAATINNGPITIIGSNGKTGSECVGACLSRNIPVCATSRSGIYSGTYSSATTTSASTLLSTLPCDVTIPSTIKSAIDGSRAVIFAASASKKGGTASAVDNIGLVNVAKACIDAKIPNLIIVSSGGVSKPDSPVYKFLNLFGKIMEEKIKGEDSVRALYKDIDRAGAGSSSSSCTYTVVRPGGLTEEDAKGVSALELNQGDTKSGRIARADVAALCIEATFFPQLAGGTTFECYDADTAKTLGAVGMSNIMKAKNTDDSVVVLSGKERRGDTFEQLFTGLDKD